MRRLHGLLLVLLLVSCLPQATDAGGGSLTLERSGETVTVTLSAGSEAALRPVIYLGGQNLATSETACLPEGGGLACAVGVPDDIPTLRRDSLSDSDSVTGRSCWDVRCRIPPNRRYVVVVTGANVSANVTFYRPDGSDVFLRHEAD